MKVIYFAHPYGGEHENYSKSCGLAAILSEKYPDYHIFNALRHFVQFKDRMNEGEVMSRCLDMVGRCDMLWLAPGWKESTGCTLEYFEATKLGLPIRYLTKDDFKEKSPKETLSKGNISIKSFSSLDMDASLQSEVAQFGPSKGCATVIQPTEVAQLNPSKDYATLIQQPTEVAQFSPSKGNFIPNQLTGITKLNSNAAASTVSGFMSDGLQIKIDKDVEVAIKDNIIHVRRAK